MTPTQHPEPAEVVGLEGVLAAHRAHVGPITGAWKCRCGEASTNGDLRKGTLTTTSERADEHTAHVAEQVRAWLGDTEAAFAAMFRQFEAMRDDRDDLRARLGAVDALAEQLEADATFEPYGGEPWSTTAHAIRAALATALEVIL